MECAKVKELLSEYLDSALDAQTKALVEGHLSVCKVCSAELASLKAYIEQLGALKEVKAPEDFLEKVHARIKRRFEFERIMRNLFVPVRIKLPLEAVAVTVVAFLIMFIYRGMQPATEIAQAPAVPEPIVIAKKPAEEPIETTLEEKAIEPEVDLAELPEPLPVKEEKPKEEKPIEEPIKLARVEESAEREADLAELEVPAPSVEEKPVERPMELASADRVGEPAVLPEPAVPMPAVKEEKPIEFVLTVRPKMPTILAKAKALRETIDQFERSRIKPQVSTRAFGPATATGIMEEAEGRKASPGPLTEALEEVKKLIAGLQGDIVGIIYDQETFLPQSITAEIPSRNYRAFLKKLAQLGSFQGPSPDELTITAKPVSVKIKFASSD